MDNIIEQILIETRLLSQQDQVFPYERYEQLVEMRQALTDICAQRAFSQAEKQCVQEILSYDSAVLEHMQQLKEQAMMGISRINTFKKQRTAYDNYGITESFMMDKKK